MQLHMLQVAHRMSTEPVVLGRVADQLQANNRSLKTRQEPLQIAGTIAGQVAWRALEPDVSRLECIIVQSQLAGPCKTAQASKQFVHLAE